MEQVHEIGPRYYIHLSNSTPFVKHVDHQIILSLKGSTQNLLLLVSYSVVTRHQRIMDFHNLTTEYEQRPLRNMHSMHGSNTNKIRYTLCLKLYIIIQLGHLLKSQERKTKITGRHKLTKYKLTIFLMHIHERKLLIDMYIFILI